MGPNKHIPEFIEDFCNQHDLSCVVIRYRHSFGYAGYGFDIVNQENEILFGVEPSHLGDNRWYARTVHEEYEGERYFKKLYPGMLKHINVEKSSFFRLKR
jgi:hypothetical protein